jgi:hypothetical protein
MDPLIAGTRIEVGQFVKIGPDGKVYPCAEDEDPISRFATPRPIPDPYVVGAYISKDEAVVISNGRLRGIIPGDRWQDVIGYAAYHLHVDDRVKLGPGGRLYRLAPPCLLLEA